MYALYRAPNTRQITTIAGGLLFFLTLLVYLARALEFDEINNYFGSLPAFSHAFFFGLLLNYFEHSKTRIVLQSLALLGLLLGFEMLQHPVALGSVREQIPSILAVYGQAGTFDLLDVAATALGALLSTSILIHTVSSCEQETV